MSSDQRGFRDRLRRFFTTSRQHKSGSQLPQSPPGPQRDVATQPQELAEGPLGTDKMPGDVASERTALSSSAKPPQVEEDQDDEDAKFPEVSIGLLTNYGPYWCCFDYTSDDDDATTAAPAGGVVASAPASADDDTARETRTKWAAGAAATFAPEFLGPKVFVAQDNQTPDAESYSLPTFLYDLVTRRVIETSTLLSPQQAEIEEERKKIQYAVISHVWGAQGVELDPRPYGVDHWIPVRNEEKLIRILEAARILVGERYIWMDILCINQDFRGSKARQADVAEMGRYFRNATGCLVWMDDAFEECGEDGWGKDVLGSLEAANAVFGLNREGLSIASVPNEAGPCSGSGAGIAIATREIMSDAAEALEWSRKIRKLERAPWFKRVWTLQEAVIPKDLLICTPEGYMTSRSTLFRLVSLVEATARQLLREGRMESVEIMQELHGSEVYKILKLQHLYEYGQIGFWHIAQAVRSRSCAVNNERMIGVSGMLQRTYPILSHLMESEQLLGETWEQALLESDFSALMYLGDRPSVYSMFADPVNGMPFITLGGGGKQLDKEMWKETHWLKLVDGVAMKDVGCDRVRSVTGVMCTVLQGALQEWMNTQTPFQDMDLDTHLSLATAWGLPKHTRSIMDINGQMKEYSPGGYAAFLSLAPSWASPILGRLKNKKFSREVKHLFPRALLHRIRILQLLLRANQGKHAVVLLQMANSEPQVGLISEPPDDTIISLTPSSYRDHPGPGCLLVKVLEDGVFHKIGIGLGRTVRADSFVSGQIIPPPRIPGLPWVYVSSLESATQG
ncbi:heterokaryon incompatibility protein-domain-containing protein [Aspergillus pseudoustus]|uniref:Heterokaryon incompatibility protein-domain-containing protein n=1 Tax=Aspergillus pseudoustus TaxID=1810923 RepID=A0ABR4ITB2_9EURO